MPRALEIASEIAALPPISIMQIKEIVNAGLNAPLDSALMLERKAFALQFATGDQKEGEGGRGRSGGRRYRDRPQDPTR